MGNLFGRSAPPPKKAELPKRVSRMDELKQQFRILTEQLENNSAECKSESQICFDQQVVPAQQRVTEAENLEKSLGFYGKDLTQETYKLDFQLFENNKKIKSLRLRIEGIERDIKYYGWTEQEYLAEKTRLENIVKDPNFDIEDYFSDPRKTLQNLADHYQPEEAAKYRLKLAEAQQQILQLEAANATAEQLKDSIEKGRKLREEYLQLQQELKTVKQQCLQKSQQTCEDRRYEVCRKMIHEVYYQEEPNAILDMQNKAERDAAMLRWCKNQAYSLM